MTILELLAYGTHEGLLKAWDTRGRKGAEGFVSPNTQTGLGFEDALRKLSSPEEKQFLGQAKSLLNKIVGSGNVVAAIGDWKDGAENSSVLDSKAASKEDMEYILAKLGQAKNQKAVLAFARDVKGKDTVWSFEDGPNMGAIRRALDKAGIEFRTIVPGMKTGVHVYDPGSVMRNQIARVAGKFGATVRFSRGTGEFIGGETREEGNQAYEGIIRRYEGRTVH